MRPLRLIGMSLFLITTCCVTYSIHAQKEKSLKTDGKNTTKERVRFVETVLRRFKKAQPKVSKMDLQDIEKAWFKIKKTKMINESDWKELYSAIMKLAGTQKYSRVTCQVKIRAVDTRNKPVKGLKVQYRFTGRHKVRTANDPTECNEKMAIGDYHIWAMRGSKSVSSKTDEFYISDEIERVTLHVRE